MADNTSETPKGVVGILTGPDGHVWASVTDFDRQSYGGYTLKDAQELRVRKQLAYDFMRATCSDIVLSVIDGHTCEEIVRDLINKKGFKRTILPVGHPVED
jgi:hypothetical protein